jgi:ER lumen protein retaining receptor
LAIKIKVSVNFLRVELLLIPVAALALLFNHEFSVMEVLWAFSIYLEAVAILPQLFMVSKVTNL